jgi:hypothetical protein
MKNINFKPYVYSLIYVILLNFILLVYTKFSELTIIFLMVSLLAYIFTILYCNWEHNKHPFKFLKKK